MRQYAMLIPVLVLVMLSGCEGSGSEAIMVTRPPRFVADRKDPEANDIYLVARRISRESITLDVYCEYRFPGSLVSSVLELNMPTAALEPIGVEVGAAWGEWPHTDPTASLQSEPNDPDAWILTSGFPDRSDACSRHPEPRQGELRFASFTIRIKQSGTFRVELEPSERYGNATLKWCESLQADSPTIETLPTFGGTVVIP